jgi:hypothetical protein
VKARTARSLRCGPSYHHRSDRAHSFCRCPGHASGDRPDARLNAREKEVPIAGDCVAEDAGEGRGTPSTGARAFFFLWTVFRVTGHI